MKEIPHSSTHHRTGPAHTFGWLCIAKWNGSVSQWEDPDGGLHLCRVPEPRVAQLPRLGVYPDHRAN
jgi:hypothetical protein